MGAVTDAERYRRVTEEGSRRKRDLAGARRFETAREQERLAVVREQSAQGKTACWEEALRRMAEAVPASTFEIWLAPLRAVAGDGQTLYLSAPEGIRAWVERRYTRLILEALTAAGAAYASVEFLAEEGGE